MFKIGNKKIVKMYLGYVPLNGGGSTSTAKVTYHIDSNDTRQYTLASGIDAAALLEPTKTGWTFAGWREDATANSSVLSSKVIGSSNIDLYAVFQKDVTLNLYDDSATPKSTTKKVYYNNNNVSNYDTISQTSKSSWTALGWSTSTAANNSIAYSNGASITITENISLYGCYSQNITLSYNGNGATSGSVASQTKARYYNSIGNYTNPSFTLALNDFIKTNHTFNGWTINSTSGNKYAVASTVTLSTNTTFYASWISPPVNFAYTGSTQSYTIPTTGVYKIEAWGADGGASTHGYAGGKGAYGSGVVTLNAGTVLTIEVGSVAGYKDGAAASYSEWDDYYDGGSWNDTEHESHGSTGGSSTITAGNVTYIKAKGGTGGTCYWDDNHGNTDDPSEGGHSGTNGTTTFNSQVTKQITGTSNRGGNGYVTITHLGDTDTTPDHIHTAACYHTHTDSCYDIERYTQCTGCGETGGTSSRPEGSGCSCGGTFVLREHRILKCSIPEGSKTCGYA